MDIIFPVCSRCTGLYAGFLASIIILVAVERKIRSGLPHRNTTIALIASFGLMSAESVLSFFGLVPASNITRFATGYITGWLVAPMIAGLMAGVAIKNPDASGKGYPSGSIKAVLWLTGAIPLAALFYFTYKKAIIAWSILSIAGLLLFVSSLVFIIIFALVKKLSNSLSSAGRFILFLGISAVVSAAVISISSALKTLAGPYIQFLVLKLQ